MKGFNNGFGEMYAVYILILNPFELGSCLEVPYLFS